MDQPQPQINYTPFKVDSDEPIREFEIQENGDVKMTETSKSVVWFHGREFISFHRQHIQDKKILETLISKEKIEETKKNIKTSDTAIKRLDPLVKDVEGKLKVAYEKTVFESKIKGIKEELTKKKSDRKPGYAEAIWSNLTDEDKTKALEKMTYSEKQEIIQFNIKKKKR